MPELPEVETVRCTLEPELRGETIHAVNIREPRLRWRLEPLRFEKWIANRTILNIARRGKYLVFEMENSGAMLIHLGMTGVLSLAKRSHEVQTHDHVIFELNKGRKLVFNDVRRFGSIDAFCIDNLHEHPRLKHLGPEPLEKEFNGDYLYERSRGMKLSIKNFVMDSRRVVGVGNIYAAEALFRAGIHPKTPARRVGRNRCNLLVEAIKQILSAAIDKGGTTISDFRNGYGEAGYFSQSLSVYGREGEPCVRCSSSVRRIVQGGRSTFYCAKCQRG